MKVFFNAIIFTTLGLTGLYLYLTYFDEVMLGIFGEESSYTLFVNNVPVIVTVADTPETLTRGLSGVTQLGQNEGKFFVFENSAKHGIWMKDMLISIDIVWIDENLNVVHIEEQVTPETFPTVFAPENDARFVLEANAHFVDTLKLTVGDRIFIPPEIMPADVRERLQQ